MLSTSLIFFEHAEYFTLYYIVDHNYYTPRIKYWAVSFKIFERPAFYCMSFYRLQANHVASFSYRIQKASSILLWQRDMVTNINTLTLIGYKENSFNQWGPRCSKLFALTIAEFRLFWEIFGRNCLSTNLLKTFSAKIFGAENYFNKLFGDEGILLKIFRIIDSTGRIRKKITNYKWMRCVLDHIHRSKITLYRFKFLLNNCNFR